MGLGFATLRLPPLSALRHSHAEGLLLCRHDSTMEMPCSIGQDIYATEQLIY